MLVEQLNEIFLDDWLTDRLQGYLECGPSKYTYSIFFERLRNGNHTLPALKAVPHSRSFSNLQKLERNEPRVFYNNVFLELVVDDYVV